MIESITEVQKQRVKEIAEEWCQRGRSTQDGPVPKEEIIVLVNKAYEQVGLERPERIEFVRSPHDMKRLAVQLYLEEFPEHTGDQAVDAFRKALRYGQHDAYEHAWVQAMEEIGADTCNGLWTPHSELGKRIGWIAYFERVCIVSEKPSHVRFLSEDDPTILHCEDGPAVMWGGIKDDGVYVIEGHRVPSFVVEHPELITVDVIRNERNAETARIMKDRYGIGRYLNDIGAQVVDVDFVPVRRDDPSGRSIIRALLRDDLGDLWLVGNDGSTPRTYFMRVDNRVETCKEAHESISGFREDKCIAQC